MEKNIRGLTIQTYMYLIFGALGFAFYYFEKFRFGVNDLPLIVSAAAIVGLGCCCSRVLKSLKIIDARLTQIEKSNS